MLNHNWIIAQSRRCVSRSQARPLDSRTDGVESRLERNLQPIPVEAGYRSTARTRTTTALSTVLFSILIHLSFLWGEIPLKWRMSIVHSESNLLQEKLFLCKYFWIAICCNIRTAGYWRMGGDGHNGVSYWWGNAWRPNSTDRVPQKEQTLNL